MRDLLRRLSRNVMFAAGTRSRVLAVRTVRIATPSACYGARGSAPWLARTEQRFARSFAGFPIRTSPHDEVSARVTSGGDRMFRGGHDYAAAYARHLERFLDKESPLIVEVGVLEGSGLALWSRLWPRATIVGLDIDPLPFERRIRRLKLLGAFRLLDPVVLRWDQLAPDRVVVAEALRGQPVDIVVDDGLHTTESIRRTAEALAPFLAENCAYFVEDHIETARAVGEFFPDFAVDTQSELTIFSR